MINIMNILQEKLRMENAGKIKIILPPARKADNLTAIYEPTV
jgi:hypothetical protein